MFQPYHRLSNCGRLRREIQQLVNRSAITDDVLRLHNKYHYAIIHKLKSGKYHLENLERLLNETPPQDVVGTTTSNDFHFLTNLHIDNYFYSLGSALDILAREILIYYSIPLPGNVYYSTARNEISRRHPGDSILPKLNDPSWKTVFSTYRNSLTHELLVVGKYTLDVSMDGNNPRQKIIVPLPDDPRQNIDDRTYRNNPDVIEYCKDILRKILSHINQLYGEISDKINSNGHLPL